MIEVTDLVKRYGATVAVDGLSFTVQPGQVTGFLGPNGAGKSTTMRTIVGLDRPTSGSTTVNGRRYIDYRRPLLEVGTLLDATAVHPGRSAANHLLALASSNRIDRSRVGEVLEQVGLSAVACRRVGGFSLGMHQRLGLAAALLGDPPVLILDEPVNGLDPEGVLWMRTLLRSLASEGRTILLSSHLMSEMALTADRVVIIGRGHLVADASIDDLLAAGDAAVHVRTPHAAELTPLLAAAGGAVEPQPDGTILVRGLTSDDVGRLAAEHAIALTGLSVKRASLEEAYMRLTDDAGEFHAARSAVS